MRLLLIPVLVLVALFVGLTWEWKYVFAPLLGFGLYRWATAMLRAMVHDGRARIDADEQQPRPVDADERILYWCEECGTELLLVIRGSGDPPKHCMERMHERAELLSN